MKNEVLYDYNQRKSKIYVMVSCFLAMFLEIYDFVVFGFLAGVLYKNYLSFTDEITGLIISYMFFAVGFVFRPLGAFIFGHIGDKYGRKKALVLSVSMMGTASLCMFCLPPYASIGIISCYIIVVVRIVQGISVGGEYSGALIYAMEHNREKKLGLICAGLQIGSCFGIMLATAVGNYVQHPTVPDYSWRFAFLIGFGLSMVGFFVRKKLRETPIYEELISTKNKIPLLEGFKQNKKKFLGGVMLAGSNTTNLYFYMMYLPNYLKTREGFLYENMGLLISGIMLFIVPVVGFLNDKYGRKNMLLTSKAFAMVGALLIISIFKSIPSANLLIFAIVMSALIVALSMVTVNIYVLEMFPANYRFSCGGLSYSIGAAIFGGTTPMVCSLILEKFDQNIFYLGCYILLISWGGFLGYSIIFSKKKLQKLQASKKPENKGVQSVC
ncbi:MAG: MFS transporter [Rickettsiaceae bacterium]|nr:MFS transporter [Rickettsiaceae bacterium]